MGITVELFRNETDVERFETPHFALQIMQAMAARLRRNAGRPRG